MLWWSGDLVIISVMSPCSNSVFRGIYRFLHRAEVVKEGLTTFVCWLHVRSLVIAHLLLIAMSCVRTAAAQRACVCACVCVQSQDQTVNWWFSLCMCLHVFPSLTRLVTDPLLLCNLLKLRPRLIPQRCADDIITDGAMIKTTFSSETGFFLTPPKNFCRHSFDFFSIVSLATKLVGC